MRAIILLLMLPALAWSSDDLTQRYFNGVFSGDLSFMPELAGQTVYNITLDKEKNPNRDYLKGSLFWHVDGTMNRKPIGAAVLSSKVLPTWGGNTEFWAE